MQNNKPQPIGAIIDNPKKEDPKRYYLNIQADDYEACIRKIGKMLVERESSNRLFEIDKLNKDVLNQLYFYLRGDDRFTGDINKGVILCGAFGCGKTTIMRVIAEIYRLGTGINVTFISTMELTDILKSGETHIKYYQHRPLLLDEIGRESETVNNFGTQRHPVEELLTLRYNSQALTFGTTNFTLEDLCERYGKYLGDRMLQMFNFIIVPGKSRRK